MKKLMLLLALFGVDPVMAADLPVATFACNYFPPQKISPPNNSAFPGYDVEILEVILGEMGYVTTFEFFPWNRAYDMVKTGQRDGLCSCSYLPERDEFFIFSEPIGVAVRGVFFRTEDGAKLTQITTLSNLKDKRVAVVRGYNLESELQDAGIKNIESVNSDKLLLNLLLFKRVDYIYSYESTIRFELKQLNPTPQLTFKGFGESPYYTCFSKQLNNGAAFVTNFNNALQKIKHDGRYQDIMLRYRAP